MKRKLLKPTAWASCHLLPIISEVKCGQ